jgi:hypothetical protein
MARSTPGFNQRSISSWMYGNAREYDCSTALAEAAIDILGLPEEWFKMRPIGSGTVPLIIGAWLWGLIAGGVTSARLTQR